VAKLRSGLPAGLCERVCRSHPVVVQLDALVGKLAKLPPCLHPHACHSCSYPAEASQPELGTWLNLEVRDLATCDAAVAAMQHLPDLRSVHLELAPFEPRAIVQEEATMCRLSLAQQQRPASHLPIFLHAKCTSAATGPQDVAATYGHVVRQLSHLPGLHSLILAHMHLCDAGAATVAAALTALIALAHLHIAFTCTAGPGLLALAWAVQHLTALDTLQFQHQGRVLGPAAPLALADALARLPCLRCLKLEEIQLNGTAQAFMERLALCSGLRDLDVTAGGLAAEGGGAMPLYDAGAVAALGRLTRLTRLKMGVCQLQVWYADAVAGSLQALAQLQHLDLTGLVSHGDSTTALAAGLRALTRLACLDLSDAWLDTGDFASMAPAIAASSDLQALMLRSNGGMLAASSTGSIRAMLAALPSLTLLDLSFIPDCTAGMPGLADVAEGGCMASLRALVFNGNTLDVDSCCTLARLLAALERLREVQLRHDDLSDAGIAKLASSLKKLSDLESVDVADNRLSGVALATLTHALQGKRMSIRAIVPETGKLPDAGSLTWVVWRMGFSE
jgi:Ran GTPase-activating protein (RanGAP) involved in mRNA processing and transport